MPELIARLGLVPHPEGGHYREVVRSAERVSAAEGSPPRCALTVIYFLLARGERSRWHRVRQEETWWHVTGGPIRIVTWDDSGGAGRTDTLGALDQGHSPYLTIPGGRWQAAEPVGDFGLAACLVAPGFEFEDLTMAADRPAIAAGIARAMPDWIRLL